MLDKRANKIILETFGTLIILILGNIVVDFKIFDAIYILVLLVYIIRYKLVKNV